VTLTPPADATWTAPDGTVWDLTGGGLNVASGVLTLPGVSGIGAVPRAVTRRPLATGGTVGRWSHADERLVAWPVEVYATDDPATYIALWRSFVTAFTQTSPPAGTPVTGTLRITRADATWRELDCTYLSGLEQADAEGEGYTSSTAVLSLLAGDPWWYGDTVIGVSFSFTSARSYLAPYETVSPTTTTGAQIITVIGDVDASPVWTLVGPATTSYTVTLPGGSFTFAAALTLGQSVTVDVGAGTVIDNLGANRIGSLVLPGAVLATLPVGVSVPVTVSIVGAGGGAGVNLSYRPRWESA
jgi:hypothetical protein